MGLMDNPKVSVDPADGSVNAEYKRAKFKNWMDLIICVAIVIGVLLYRETMASRSCAIVFGQNEITMTTPESAETAQESHIIVFDELESVELYSDFDAFDRGELISGGENNNSVYGTYRSAELGEYFMCVTPKYEVFIIARQPDGVFVFNYESSQSTSAAYEFLEKIIADNQSK